MKNEKIRKKKVFMILNTLEKQSKNPEESGIDKETLIAAVCLDFGAGERYVKEIIKHLKLTGQIQEVNKKLYFIKRHDSFSKTESALSPEEKEMLNREVSSE
jgi:hypothetical protein